MKASRNIWRERFLARNLLPKNLLRVFILVDFIDETIHILTNSGYILVILAEKSIQNSAFVTWPAFILFGCCWLDDYTLLFVTGNTDIFPWVWVFDIIDFAKRFKKLNFVFTVIHIHFDNCFWGTSNNKFASFGGESNFVETMICFKLEILWLFGVQIPERYVVIDSKSKNEWALKTIRVNLFAIQSNPPFNVGRDDLEILSHMI